MLEKLINLFRKFLGAEQKKDKSKDAAKERLHLVLIQDRASVSADFLEAMKQEIIEVIKKYIVVDESAIDVRLTNQTNEDGTNGAPALYANIPIGDIRIADPKLAKEETKNEEPVEKQEKEEVNESAVSEKKVEEEIQEPITEENKENKEEVVVNVENN